MLVTRFVVKLESVARSIIKFVSLLELSVQDKLIWKSETAAAERLLGAMGAGIVIVTADVPLIDPLVARTVADPAVPGAVYKPEELIVPPPEITDHVIPGCVPIASPN